MGEIHRKWFTITVAVLLLVSVVLNWLIRETDIMWVHNPGVILLHNVVSWISLVVSVILFVWYNIVYWRTSRRLFWRKWRKWAKGLLIGIVMLVVLLLAVNFFRADKVELNVSERHLLLIVFAAAGLILGLARYKFNRTK